MSFFDKIHPLFSKGARCWMSCDRDLEELEELANFWLPNDYVAMLKSNDCSDRYEVDLRSWRMWEEHHLYLYNSSEVKKITVTHGLTGILPKALIMGHNGLGGLLLLVGGATRLRGIYRVMAEQLVADGLTQAVFVAPSVTTLLRHGQNLDRVFFSISRRKDEKLKSWEGAVQASYERVRVRCSGKAGSIRWRFAALHEQMAEVARVGHDPVLNNSDWPEILADRLRATHFSEAERGAEEELRFDVPVLEAGQTQNQTGRGKSLLSSLHPCLSLEQAVRPPPPQDVLHLLDSLSMPAPEEYLDLMDECSSLTLSADLQVEGHAGKTRRLQIWEPYRCWQREPVKEDPELLPPFVVLGDNRASHLLAYSAGMSPPGLYLLARYGAYDGDPRPMYITDSLQSLLLKGEGLAVLFQPVLEHERAVERLAKFGAEVKRLDESSDKWGDGSGQLFRPYLMERTVLEDLIVHYLTPDIYDPESLADRCQRGWPQSAELRVFKVMLKAALDEPGLVTPQMYVHWTGGDDSYDTQAKLQAHLQYLWNLCFPTEARHEVTG